MSVDAEGGARALRGVWAWLRRSQRAASLDSLSSAGSARTAASFSFVPQPRRTCPAPATSWRRRDPALRPSAPNLPLHIKYGLPLDTNTLPVQSRAARPARRAFSEYGRRAAHVPGKRRAPAPPTSSSVSSTVPRRAHKRPAPRPPSCSDENVPPLSSTNCTPGLMDSPPSKTRSSGVDEPTKSFQSVKMKSEKNFLRQIFENKFRSSIVEPAPTRVLPSISELDREAEALIRCNRERSLKDNEVSGSSIYTQTDFKQINKKNELNNLEEKEKLKEMLKEIKDSLPKRSNLAGNANNSSIPKNSARQKFFENEKNPSETPTLPIAIKHASNYNKVRAGPHVSQNKTTTVISVPLKPPKLVTHQVILMDSMAREDLESEFTERAATDINKNMNSIIDQGIIKNKPMTQVSAPFNPIYIPKNSGLGKISKDNPRIHDHSNNVLPPPNASSNAASQTKTTNSKALVPDILRGTGIHNDVKLNNSVNLFKKIRNEPAKKIISPDFSNPKTSEVVFLGNKNANFNVEKISEHSRRRELVNQLEKSIAQGDQEAAADAAMKLAQLRLSCSVLSFTSNIMEQQPCTSRGLTTANAEAKDAINPAGNSLQFNRQKAEDIIQSKKVDHPSICKSTDTPCSSKDRGKQHVKPIIAEPSTSSKFIQTKENTVSVKVWVEDKETTRGPIYLNVPHNGTLKDLRHEADKRLGLAVRLQRWIVGNSLCNDDDTSLVSLAGLDFKAPFYLYLVESDSSSTVFNEPINNPQSNVYTELLKLEQRALAPNIDIFECQVCMEQCKPGEGVVLRECVHSFCRNCLEYLVKNSVEPVVSCPATDCPGILQEREVRGLMTPNDYERWLARGLAVAESGIRNTFHCRTPDCKGWALFETGVKTFPCPVCNKCNCVQCQAIHEGQSCEEYLFKLEIDSKITEEGQTDEGTKALITSLISRGEALECPECRAIITKKWGCDWIKCSACKTEICWVTRGRRWGPGGRGDTSAGCRCGVDGHRCHPSCGYCH